MADTLTINVRDIRYSDKVHIRIPVIGQTSPCFNYVATENQIRQLIALPNYEVRDAATGVIVNGHNLHEYFPGGGGGGGTTNYNELSNRPQINNKTLTGNKSSSDLGLQDELTPAQQNAVDSGIDNTKVEQIATNSSDISDLKTQVGYANTELEGVL